MKRREFLRLSAMFGAANLIPWQRVKAQIPGGTLAPGDVAKYVLPLVKPPAMPMKEKDLGPMGVDKYKIAVRQFQQRILSPPHPKTTVWSYGSADHPGTVPEGGTFNYPAFTIEATHGRAVQVEWINDLVDAGGNFLPHILPVDQTLHWANPPGGKKGRNMRGTDPSPYMGPVPIVTHVHGAHTYEQFDGYPEAWYLPAARNIRGKYAHTGTFYDAFVKKYKLAWDPGTAVFRYPNDQRATTLWYHDHTLGMTRLNVYAGPAGFFLIRGGPEDRNLGYVAPGVGDDPLGEYTETPIVIQDRSFNADGSLFYPGTRAFFEGLDPSQLQIPFIPDFACNGRSDISPIWNPEFFGNMMVVNGFTWPFLEVQQRRYRFRFLNGCNSRFLILKFDNGQKFYQIGTEGGFLPAPVELNQLLMAPAERADVIVDFTNLPLGTEIILLNLGPDEPFGGGAPGIDFDPADPDCTGQIMQFRVVAAQNGDPTTPPMDLVLPAITPIGMGSSRQVSLNEEESETVEVSEDGYGNIVLDCQDGEEFGPRAALLGVLDSDGDGEELKWSDAITENPGAGATEQWEIYNFTEDAHPIHIHLVQFQVVGRVPVEEEGTSVAGSNDPLPWETGFKDTVIAYPGEITRVKARFDIPGLYVWHCHIVEHEDNEMMRPYRIGSED